MDAEKLAAELIARGLSPAEAVKRAREAGEADLIQAAEAAAEEALLADARRVDGAGYPEMSGDDRVRWITGERDLSRAMPKFRRFAAWCLRRDKALQVAEQRLDLFEAEERWGEFIEAVASPSQGEVEEWLVRIKTKPATSVTAGFLQEAFCEWHTAEISATRSKAGASRKKSS